MRTIAGLGVALSLLASCGGEDPPGEKPIVTAQRIRTSWHGEGTFVAIGVLATDAGGDPLGCDEGSLSVTVEWSDAGEAGPYTAIPGADVVRACGPAGGDLALVLDNSGSLNQELPVVKGASRALFDGVVDAGGRASLVRVSTNAEVLAALGDDPAAIGAAIDGLHDSDGWTALWDGVRMGNETLGEVPGAPAPDLATFCADTPRAGVVVFTDGAENNSADQQDYDHASYPGDGIATTLEDLQQLQSDGASTPIYTIGFGDEVDEEPLRALAEATGARYLHVDGEEEIDGVFGVVGDYFATSHQVCAEVPDGTCGPLWIRVSWEYTAPNGATTSGDLVQALSVDCPVDATGRSVLLMLTLTNPGISDGVATTLAANAVSWASPVADPRVLVVLDENHHDEFRGDADAIATMLGGEGYTVDRLDEADGGVTIDDLQGHDVVWYSNPGYPMDDLGTREALEAWQASGGGLVLQGDDMSWSMGDGFSMSPLTHLDHVSNGTEFCGTWTDNNQGGSYRVTLADDAHPVIAGLEGTSFTYGDDIDTSVPRGEGEEVLATATLDGGAGCDAVPVILAWEP